MNGWAAGAPGVKLPTNAFADAGSLGSEAIRLLRWLVPISWVALALAGCVQPAADVDPASLPAAGLPSLRVGDAVSRGTEPLVWEGKKLVGEGFSWGPGSYWAPPCTPSSCETVPFVVEGSAGRIEVSIEWEHQEADYSSVSADTVPLGHYLGLPNAFMTLRILDASGNLVQDGVNAFHFASVALLDDLPPGEYAAEVKAMWGESTYRGVVQVEPLVPPPEGELLPDLGVLPPTELTLEHPIGREGPDPLVPLGRKGCDPDEAFEFGAVRCLRFATAFANHGPGRLEMHLSREDVQEGILGEGRWVQRLYDAAGGYREVEASAASYHKVHGHFHILGLDVSTVYAYDEATGTRGEPLGEGRKTGFCPVDSALIEPLGLGTTYPVAYAGCCYMWGFCQLDMATQDDLEIGLSPSWYDVYPWWRADQYVDIGDAPDGTYELETCANPEGSMTELRTDNNCASTLFRLTGNKVEMLGPPSPPA